MDAVAYMWRDTEGSEWRKGHGRWTRKDISFLNRVCGYQKYRLVS